MAAYSKMALAFHFGTLECGIYFNLILDEYCFSAI